MNADRPFVTFEKLFCFIFLNVFFFFNFSALHLTFKTLRKMRGRMGLSYASFVRWLTATQLPLSTLCTINERIGRFFFYFVFVLRSFIFV